jgi:ATP-dependent DNA ligase
MHSDAAPAAPFAPMLARLTRELPIGEFSYEPKWDGFRCLAFCCPARVELRSRNGRPLARYFPELVEALSSQLEQPAVLDGEVVIAGPHGFDFAALLARLHPAASRVARLREETPARYIAFDLLALGSSDLREWPFSERRCALAALLERGVPPLCMSPITDDPAVARQWLDLGPGAGVDGVVAKARDLRYQPGIRAMIKVKRERTIDCVVAGLRLRGDGRGVSSLLLGLYDRDGRLVHIGVCSAFSAQRSRKLLDELRALAAHIEGHPWEHGFLLGGGALGRLAGAAARWNPAVHELDWIPLAPQPVCEVSYDHIDASRLRHPARFVRWRSDRDPQSCLLEQLSAPQRDPLEILATP